MMMRPLTVACMLVITACGGSKNSGAIAPADSKKRMKLLNPGDRAVREKEKHDERSSEESAGRGAIALDQVPLDQEDEIFRRMTPEEANGLPAVEDSICRSFTTREPRTFNQCRFIGPFQGELETGGKSALFDTLEGAMGACAGDLSCMGVSTDWYTGAPWFPVSTSTVFRPDENSYGCSFIIQCE